MSVSTYRTSIDSSRIQCGISLPQKVLWGSQAASKGWVLTMFPLLLVLMNTHSSICNAQLPQINLILNPEDRSLDWM